MSGRFLTIAWAIVLGMLPVFLGCNNELKAKDAHIALIEDANQQLTDDLAAARRESDAERNENDALRRERDGLNGQVLAFQGQVSLLNEQINSRPEPVAADGWQAVPGGAMIAIEGSVLFASGKQSLRDSGKGTLSAIAGTIQSSYADKDILVFGHTDDQPIKKSGWKDNYELSAQRALSVVRFLRDRGITPGRLVACGAGEHRPRVANSNEANRAKNRRVEIFAIDPTGR